MLLSDYLLKTLVKRNMLLREETEDSSNSEGFQSTIYDFI